MIGPYAPLTMVTSNNSRLRFYWGRFFARGPEGGHRMTDKIEACATVLYDAAMERAQDDPDLARADFESFCNVMWTDDGDMERAGLTREEFRLALQGAWMKMPKPG